MAFTPDVVPYASLGSIGSFLHTLAYSHHGLLTAMYARHARMHACLVVYMYACVTMTACLHFVPLALHAWLCRFCVASAVHVLEAVYQWKLCRYEVLLLDSEHAATQPQS